MGTTAADTPEPKSGIRQEIEFLESIEAAADERAAAYAVRDKDPARWKAAKQAYADLRRYYRGLAGRTEHGASAVSAGEV